MEAVIYELEHEWLTDPRPISKDSVKHARLVMEAAVKKVWFFFRRLLSVFFCKYKKQIVIIITNCRNNKKLLPNVLLQILYLLHESQ